MNKNRWKKILKKENHLKKLRSYWNIREGYTDVARNNLWLKP